MLFKEKGQTKPCFRWLAALLAVTLVITMSPILQTSAFGAEKAAASSLKTQQPEILVSGTAVIGADRYAEDNIGLEKAYTREELKAMNGGSDVEYSAINTATTKKFYKASGVYLESLLQGTKFDAAEDKLFLTASDGYSASFDPDATYKNGSAKTTGFDQPRYYYPELMDGSEAGKKEVKTMLAWASDNNETKMPESAGAEQDMCMVVAGQLASDDQNNPLYNKNMQRVIGGDALEKTALTVDGKTYTRGDVLLMERAEAEYTYNTSGGERTDFVRGVPMSVLLKGYDENSKVALAAADGYEVEANNMTVKELIDNDFILAYEKGADKGSLEGIFDTAKKDPSIEGYFTLYGNGENGKPAKMVNSITVMSSSGTDFANSPYKHITNGGDTSKDGPYNIDGITGATLTIEGPGVKNSVPLSVRDLENENAGAFRGDYTDTRSGKATERTYEGIDLYHILTRMSTGDNGIVLTDTAKKVQIKNRVRETIATFTLDQVKKLSEAGNPILVAYGTSYTDGTNIRPFVFDNAAGQDLELGNDDGCLKLVYDKEANAGDLNGAYKEFGNMAYIYVAEETSPGYKHDKDPYKTAENSQYVLTVTGKEIGREVNYTVQELEDMVKYDSQGRPEAGGVGHRDEYSLANSAYWYVNEYEGVKLWDLLQMSGLPANKSTDGSTKVKFSATDGYTSFDEFTLKQIADPNSFGYYEKSADDLGDGKYVPKAEDLKEKGFPVLVAYGVNGYPYVIKNTLDGYLSGLSNDGGPLRIISGKMDYHHANGSNQAKLLDKVLVGADTYHYSTHKYHEKDVYKKQAEQTLNVKILNGSDKDAPVMKEQTYKVGDIEELIYGGKLNKAELAEAKVKGFYEIKKGDSFYNDLYEGVNLNYFLKNIVELPGQKGTITFSDGTNEVKVNLQDLLKMNNGYNTTTKLDNLSPVLAYGKNGAPMVPSKEEADGYEGNVTLGTGTLTKEMTVKNNGGPLSVIIPNSSQAAKDAQDLTCVTSITINLSPDNYAHVKAPYDAYKDSKIKVSGEGTRLTGEKEFTVTDLEGKQTLAETADYSILKNGETTPLQQRFRGISLYDFLNSTDVGLKNNADKVIVTCSDGSKKEFTLSEVRKADYINSVTGAKDLKMILAYGSAPAGAEEKEDGRPLVKDEKSKGYVAEYKNSGGPIRLVVGQTDEKDANNAKNLKEVTAIEVTAGEMVSWNHSSSEVFKQYLTDTVKLQVIDQNDKKLMDKDYTIEELEKMTALIERAEITGTSKNTWEGINFWDFVLQETTKIQGMDDLISVTVFAKDGFNKDILSNFGKDALENGIKDGDLRVPILLAYGMDGLPLASGSKSNPNGPGYDSTIGNNGGPIRLMTHNNQGSCLSEANKIVVKIKEGSVAPSEDPIKFQVAAGGKELPEAGIRSVKFDADGGMWIGTYGGGAAYKAKGDDQFTVYDKNSDPALETGFVSALAPDADGGVWMSQNASYTDPTANKGVVYLKDGKITSYRAGTTPATIPDDYVQDIKVDENGCVWFASFGGLTKYDPKAGTWKTWNKNDGFPAMSVDKIEFDGKGGVWVGFYPDGAGTAESGFAGGFAHMTADGKITAYPQKAGFDTASNQSKLADVWIRDIAVDKNGGAWITASGAYANIENTGGTLWYVSAPGAEAKKYTGDQLFGKALDGAGNAEIRMVEADNRGGLWFGTSADGIFHVEDPTLGADGTFRLTAEYSTETRSWENPLLNNVYSLDVIGSMIYSGTSGGLAYVDYLAADGKNNIGDASAGDCDLAITGKGTVNNAFFTIKGLKNAEGIVKDTKTYAWQNSSGTTGTTEVEGAYVENILKDVVGLNKNASTVTVTARDGYEKTFDLADMSKADMNGLKPMLAWKEAGEKVDPKLVIGPKDAADKNKSKWISDIVKITVDAQDDNSSVLKEGVKKTTLKAKSTQAKNGSYIRVEWTKSPGYAVDYYEVFKSTDKNKFSAKPYYKIKGKGLKGSYKNTKELVHGKTYYYKVRGVRTIDGEKVYTKWSNLAYRKVNKAAQIKKGVQNTTLKINTQTGGIVNKYIKVNWTKSAGYAVDHYEIYKSTKKNGFSAKPYFTKKASGLKGWYKNTKGVKRGNTYYYKVRGVRTVDGKKVYTKWSNVASRKV